MGATAAKGPTPSWRLSAGPLETAAHLGTAAVGDLGGGLTYLGTLAASGGDTAAAKAVQEAAQEEKVVR